MTDQQIENLLRKAPRVAVPEGLRERLQAEMTLPLAEASRPGRRELASGFKRWLPVLSFAAFFLACLVVIAVQSNSVSELQRENQNLRGAAQELEPLRRENAEFHHAEREHQELEKLRRDNMDLQKLRAEVTKLRDETKELEKLRTENQRLLAEAKAAGGTNSVDEFFARTEDGRARSESIVCINNLKQIGLAARIWANDHNDVFPPDFLSMKGELSTPRILVCPADKDKNPANDWSKLTPANISYEMLSPGVSVREPTVVYVRCPVHRHIGLVDGSVQAGQAEKVVMKNGKAVFE